MDWAFLDIFQSKNICDKNQTNKMGMKVKAIVAKPKAITEDNFKINM